MSKPKDNIEDGLDERLEKLEEQIQRIAYILKLPEPEPVIE